MMIEMGLSSSSLKRHVPVAFEDLDQPLKWGANVEVFNFLSTSARISIACNCLAFSRLTRMRSLNQAMYPLGLLRGHSE